MVVGIVPTLVVVILGDFMDTFFTVPSWIKVVREVGLVNEGVTWVVGDAYRGVVVPMDEGAGVRVPVLGVGEGAAMPGQLVIFIALGFTLSLSSVSSAAVSSLSSMSKLTSGELSAQSRPDISVSSSPCYGDDRNYFAYVRGELSLVGSALSFPLLLGSNDAVFIPDIETRLLVSRRGSLVLLV